MKHDKAGEDGVLMTRSYCRREEYQLSPSAGNIGISEDLRGFGRAPVSVLVRVK